MADVWESTLEVCSGDVAVWKPNLEAIGVVNLEEHHRFMGQHRIHDPRVQLLWDGLTAERRAKILGQLRVDHIKRHINALVPEWNEERIATEGSNLFLAMLCVWAYTEVLRTCFQGVEDILRSDYDVIVDFIATLGVQDDPEARLGATGWYLRFNDKQHYGKAVWVDEEEVKKNGGDRKAIETGRMLPVRVGVLLMKRHFILDYILSCMIDLILKEAGSQPLALPKSLGNRLYNALTVFIVHKNFLSLLGNCMLYKDPTYLSDCLEAWYNSRPELELDDRGRVRTTDPSTAIGDAIFDTCHHATLAPYIWGYIFISLDLLKKEENRSGLSFISQEISNAIHLYYSLRHTVLRRGIWSGSCVNYFKRISTGGANGIERIILKDTPDRLAGNDRHTHCFLRLFETEIDISKAADLLLELEDIYTSDPYERDYLSQLEITTLGELNHIVTFHQLISQLYPLPAYSPTTNQKLATGIANIKQKLDQYKSQLDFSSMAAPGVGGGGSIRLDRAMYALTGINKFLKEKTGFALVEIYCDVIKRLAVELPKQVEEARALEEAAARKAAQKAEKAAKKAARKAARRAEQGQGSAQKKPEQEYIPFPPEAPKTPEPRVPERRQKEKTRPAQPPVRQQQEGPPLADDHDDNLANEDANKNAPKPAAPRVVKAATAATFAALFRKGEARGSLAWSSLEAAMADLGFSVISGWGSAIIFDPPRDTMPGHGPIHFHRPHASHIEGSYLFVFADRFNRQYGWDEDTFQTA